MTPKFSEADYETRDVRKDTMGCMAAAAAVILIAMIIAAVVPKRRLDSYNGVLLTISGHMGHGVQAIKIPHMTFPISEAMGWLPDGRLWIETSRNQLLAAPPPYDKFEKLSDAIERPGVDSHNWEIMRNVSTSNDIGVVLYRDEAAIAPDGKRSALICEVDNLESNRARCVVRICDLNGYNEQSIAWAPGILLNVTDDVAPLSALRWLPDGKSVSVVSGDTLYIIPVGP